MYRILKTLPWAGAACGLAVTMACSNAPSSPASPAAVTNVDGSLGPDGSTLKASPPTVVSPTNDFRLTNRTPTLTLTNSSGLFAGGAFSYEFQLLNDGGSVLASNTVSAGGGTTSWLYPTDLDRDTPYRWRARARMGGAFGPWSSVGRFFTVKENRTPDPPGGQRIPFPSWGAGVVNQVAAQRPDLLGRSCQDHGGTWEFMDLVVDTLRLQDSRWGYNGKRGNPNDPSLDVINYNWGSGPDQGSRQVYTIDIILSHCGSPAPAWIDLTDPNGAGAIWISRGRF